jgi:acetylglutamate kinase
MDVCSRNEYDQGTAEGWIAGGMRVKLAAAFDALRSGVENVYVLSHDNLVSRKDVTRIVEFNT